MQPFGVDDTTDTEVWSVSRTGTVHQSGGLQLLGQAVPPALTRRGYLQLWSPDGLTLNTLAPDGTVTQVASGTGTVTPANQNLIAWTYDPVIGVNSSTVTNGVLFLSAVYPTRNATVTKLYTQVVTAAITPVAGQNFIGLYSSAGVLLTSANIDTPIASTGLLTATVTAAAVTAGSMYWVGILANAATAPLLARGQSLNGADTTANVGLSAATYRFAQNGSARTALPSPLVPASNTLNTFAGPWAAIG